MSEAIKLKEPYVQNPSRSIVESIAHFKTLVQKSETKPES